MNCIFRGFLVRNRKPQREYQGPSCYKIRKFCKTKHYSTSYTNKFIFYTPKGAIPYEHDLYWQLGLKTRMVVGVTNTRNLIRGRKTAGTESSTDWVRPLEVTSYNGYWVPQSNLAISPKWTSPLMNITPFLCTKRQSHHKFHKSNWTGKTSN
jgi:hypothetical protein